MTCRAPKAAGIYKLLAKSRTPAAKAPAHVFSGDKSAESLQARYQRLWMGEFYFFFIPSATHCTGEGKFQRPFHKARALLGDRPGCSPVTLLFWVAARFASSLVSQSIVSADSVNGAQLTQGAIHATFISLGRHHCLYQLHFDDCACTICSARCPGTRKSHYSLCNAGA